MKPRIFVSSTYYDLKYIRNDLESFIKSYGYDSVLFESGDITFSSNNLIENSCYEELKTCNMCILIVGGRYGSLSSQSTFKNNYDQFVESITVKEYSNAKDNNIPIYIFVEKNVESEYQTYLKNKDKNITYAHVDNVNIYKFLERIYSTNFDYVYKFENFEDIKKQLIEQWAGLMFLYLKDLKDKKQLTTLNQEVETLRNISEKMDIAINAILETTITEEKLKVVKKQQDDVYINNLAKTFINLLPSVEGKSNKKDVKKFLDYIIDFVKDIDKKATMPKVALKNIEEKYQEIFNDLFIEYDISKLKDLVNNYHEKFERMNYKELTEFKKIALENFIMQL